MKRKRIGGRKKGSSDSIVVDCYEKTGLSMFFEKEKKRIRDEIKR